MLTFSMSGGTLDRHETARTQPGFAAARMQPDCHPRLVLVKGISIAVTRNDSGKSSHTTAATSTSCSWHRPLDHDMLSHLTAVDELVYLGEMDGDVDNDTATHNDNAAAAARRRAAVRINVFALDVRHVTAAYAAGLQWASTKSPYITTLSRDAQAAVGLALSLCAWHAKSRYCARCGHATLTRHDVGFSRRCTRCRAQHFPQLMPAVLVTVLDGAGRVLLSQRRAADPTLTILSGFVLHGESAEEAVRREVYEESGVRVRSLRYAGSQTWPYPHLLMLSYYAVADDAAATALTVQADELVRVCWVDKAAVRQALQMATTTAGKATKTKSSSNSTAATVRVPPVWTAAHTMLRHWVDGDVDDCGNAVSRTAASQHASSHL